jgi:two-component system alkaline phosphatase synthesis response regulator PhoP
VKIYIVEDDADIGELESYALNSSGFETEVFPSAAGLYQAIYREMPELILLDIMLPGENGLDVLRRLRSDPKTREIKIILVTAKATEMDTVRGLDMGADDYITKPFGIMELVSRVKARVRRSAGAEETVIGRIRIDNSSRTVYVDGTPCGLTYKEFELLALLAANPDVAMSRDTIMDKVWGYDYMGSTRTLDMHIKTLRKKLGAGGAYIKTVRNVGYILTTGENK